MRKRPSRNPIPRLALAALLPSTIAPAQQPPLSDQEIVARIDSAVQQRSDKIARYTVEELYSVYRNGENQPSAQETVLTTYTRANGKDYAPISHSGSSLLRNTVIAKVLAGEKELNLPANREAAWLTSANYEMHPEPNTVDINGHKCIVIDLVPRRKTPHLFNGKEWVDASDFTIVRLAGSPSESPSLFAGQTTVTRDYEKVDGFAMATHAEAYSHTALFGETLMKIDYTGYKIERVSSASAAQPPNVPLASKPPTSP